MRNQNSKVRVTKRKLPKCIGICRTFNDIQFAYSNFLVSNENIKEFRCNILLENLSIDGKYTTDFVCTRTNGDIFVRECVDRSKITKPLTIKLLDLSREYWLKRGINDWGIVVNEEK